MTPSRTLYAPVVLAFSLAACGDDGDRTADAAAGADAEAADAADAAAGTDAAAAETCDDILVSGSAEVNLFDLYRGGAEIPLEILVDGCPIVDDLVRGGFYGAGILEGARTLSVVVDDEALPSEALDAQAGDAFWFAMDNRMSPPLLYRAEGSTRALPDGWQVHLMNMSGEDITIARAVDADATAYEVVAADLHYGETFAGELPVFAESGVPVRIERGGTVRFEDNLGFYFACMPGEWPGGFTIFAIIDDSEVGVAGGVVYPTLPCGSASP